MTLMFGIHIRNPTLTMVKSQNNKGTTILRFWAEHVPAFRDAIRKYGCFNDDGEQDIDVTLEIFRIFGFMDCLQTATCHPGSGPVNEGDDRVENRFGIQRVFFTA